MRLFLSVLIATLTGCAPDLAPDRKIGVMTFNAENLFDGIGSRSTELEEGALRSKLAALARVILQVPPDGPDVLLLQEVENRRILSRLNREYLAKAGYVTEVLLEGWDPRGIDVALLSRWPLAGPPRLHPVRLSPGGPALKSRGILEVPLRREGAGTLTVFNFHFPSQLGPAANRHAAFGELIRLLKAQKGDWIAGGDSNVTSDEERRLGLWKKHLPPLGVLSHRVGCSTCLGTHFYRGRGDFLDVLIVSRSLADGPHPSLRLIRESIRTPAAAPGQLDARGRPRRFDPVRRWGASDHLPLYAELERIDFTGKSANSATPEKSAVKAFQASAFMSGILQLFRSLFVPGDAPLTSPRRGL